MPPPAIHPATQNDGARLALIWGWWWGVWLGVVLASTIRGASPRCLEDTSIHLAQFLHILSWSQLFNGQLMHLNTKEDRDSRRREDPNTPMV